MCVTDWPAAVWPSPKFHVYVLEAHVAVNVTVSGALPDATLVVCPQAACAAGANASVSPNANPNLRTRRNVVAE